MTILLLLLVVVSLKVWFRNGLRDEENHYELLNKDSG